MLSPNNTLNVQVGANAVIPGVYTSTVNQAVTAFNQVMMKYAEYFDPFIQAALIESPRHWYNVIRRGVFPNFSGTTHETRVFRGGLQKYAGLDEWADINPNPTSGNNPCVRGAYNTVSYAWERFQWSGKVAYWGSDPICVDSIQYTPQGIEQLAWILQVGANYGIGMQEVWNRDMLIKTAIDADRGYLMTSEYLGNASAPKFYYDPFVKFGNGSGEVAPATGITKPFIVWKAGTEIEMLNFDVLDMLHQDFEVSCRGAAIGSNGGSPLFGLPISKFDFERFIKGNTYELANWREAAASKLISGVTDVRSHRDWALPFDGNQLRFKIAKVVSDYDSDDYGGVASDLDGETVMIAQAVDPLIAGRTGENGQQIPEWNPEYGTAELAVAPIQLKDVFTNLMGSDLSTLGSGTSFGPQLGLNGQWSWINILDRTTNPHGKIGNFAGEFRIWPKVEPHVVFSTALLYRRCTESIRSRCPVDNADVNPDIAQGGSADAADYTASGADTSADTFTLTAVLEKKLQEAPPGKTVQATFSGLAEDVVVEGYLTKTSAAPTYTIFITASGVMDIVAVGSAGYYVEDGVLKYKTGETVTSLVLDSVAVV
jgi:hypothetical protein